MNRGLLYAPGSICLGEKRKKGENYPENRRPELVPRHRLKFNRAKEQGKFFPF